MLITSFDNKLINLRGALHVGANVGEECHWYNTLGFTKVYWFEPNMELFPTLRANIEPFPNQKAFSIGIHDTLDRATLHIANNAGQSSSLLEFGTHSTYYPAVKYIRDEEIPLWRMDDFFEAMGWKMADFNFLNIDVQGVELNVIKSFGSLIGKLDYIYTEVNIEQVYKGCCLMEEIDAYLFPYGFVREVTLVKKAKWGDALYVRK